MTEGEIANTKAYIKGSIADMIGDKKISILVIDDEPSVLQAIENILTDKGYRVLAADSGLKGLNIILKNEIDIVFLDVWMPEMDGIETLVKIKEKHPKMKVILMSGHGTIETAVRGMQLGASNFIEKPFSLDKLLNTIEANAQKKEIKFFHCFPDVRIRAAFYETICIYPAQKNLLLYLGGFCSERFFKVIVATDWTDILAIPKFITIINPLAVMKRDWSVLYGYLTDVPDTHERFVLSSNARQPTILKSLRKFFKTIKDRPVLGKYILRCNKETVRKMTRQQKSAFIDQRRRDVKKILKKSGAERDFLIGKYAKYYNVNIRTIKRDLEQIS